MRIIRRLRTTLAPAAVDRDMDAEMRFHVEMEAADLAARGVPPDEARRLALLRFGGIQRYKEEGRDARGAGPPGMSREVIPRAWIDSSWVARTRSDWSGHDYGYGWWIRSAWTAHGRHAVYYAWGYGGQFIFVVPDAELVVVVTSDPEVRSREEGHLGAIHALVDEEIIPAVGG